MQVQKLRLQHGWSQQQLADLSGLSVRTIQRIENGQTPSIETLKSLASVFEIDFSHLQAEPVMNSDNPDSFTRYGSNPDSKNPESTTDAGSTTTATKEMLALRHVAKVRQLYVRVARYIIIMAFLTALNLLTSPHYLWVVWPALGWGLGLLLHAASTLELIPFLGADWEKREVEKRLGRKL